MGIVIIFCLNQTPARPRGRDHVYTGSLCTSAVWIGMEAAGIIRMLRNYAKIQELPAAVLALVFCLSVPIQMVGQI